MRSFFISIFIASLLPVVATAATISIDPEVGSYGPGDTFIATVRIDTESADECINALDVELTYPRDLMRLSAVSKGESLLSLWTEDANIISAQERGVVSFGGGIPGGYCGRVVGDPGKTNVLAKLIFTIPSNQIGGVIPTTTVPMLLSFTDSTTLLLNDGQGTPAPLLRKNGAYIHLLEPRGVRNEWIDEVQNDDTPPEEFVVSMQKDANIANGRYVLIFSTLDKQSGLDHFEIKEEAGGSVGMFQGKKPEALFVRATSPYELKDQTLKSAITVRAIDYAGNIREVVLGAQVGEGNEADVWWSGPWHMGWVIIVAIILLSILIIVMIWRRWNKLSGNVETSRLGSNKQPPYDQYE